MNYDNEILTLLFGIGTLIFMVTNLGRLRHLPHASLFLTGFVLLLPGWTATLFDQMFWGELFNAIEHVAYAAGMAVFVLWTYLVVNPRGERQS